MRSPNPQVTLPADFSTSCDKVAACKAYPLSLSTYYYSNEGSSVATIENVIAGLPNAISSLPALTVISGGGLQARLGRHMQVCSVGCLLTTRVCCNFAGVVNVTMNYTAGTGDLFCTGGTCSASLQLPLTSAYSASAAQVIGAPVAWGLACTAPSTWLHTLLRLCGGWGWGWMGARQLQLRCSVLGVLTCSRAMHNTS
jgi:hypothetical protein